MSKGPNVTKSLSLPPTAPSEGRVSTRSQSLAADPPPPGCCRSHAGGESSPRSGEAGQASITGRECCGIMSLKFLRNSRGGFGLHPATIPTPPPPFLLLHVEGTPTHCLFDSLPCSICHVEYKMGKFISRPSASVDAVELGNSSLGLWICERY